jgi:peptidoglycan-N-acetylglucosamine deacetylase
LLIPPVFAAVVAFTPPSPREVPALYRSHVITRRFPTGGQKLLALTIDDGPTPRITPKMLDILRARKARATFFVLGSLAAGQPNLLRRMVKEGHAIGSHTYTHRYFTTQAEAEDELHKTAAAIKSAIGFSPTLFRPPGGFRDSWTYRLAKEEGYTVVLWTIDSFDCQTGDSGAIARNATRRANPGDIILIHDAAAKRPTLRALPRILDDLIAKGWRFVTIPELMQIAARNQPAQTAKRTSSSRHNPFSR